MTGAAHQGFCGLCSLRLSLSLPLSFCCVVLCVLRCVFFLCVPAASGSLLLSVWGLALLSLCHRVTLFLFACRLHMLFAHHGLFLVSLLVMPPAPRCALGRDAVLQVYVFFSRTFFRVSTYKDTIAHAYTYIGCTCAHGRIIGAWRHSCGDHQSLCDECRVQAQPHYKFSLNIHNTLH